MALYSRTVIDKTNCSEATVLKLAFLLFVFLVVGFALAVATIVYQLIKIRRNS